MCPQVMGCPEGQHTQCNLVAGDIEYTVMIVPATMFNVA